MKRHYHTEEKLNESHPFVYPEPNTGCWLWAGGVSDTGYGRVRIKSIRVFTHRLSYQLHKGAIPSGMQVCHTCDTPSCINPSHLFLGTRQDNNDDKVKKKRHRFGERHPLAKLTPVCAQIIREACLAGFEQKQLASYFHVGQPNISRIVRNKLWIQ